MAYGGPGEIPVVDVAMMDHSNNNLELDLDIEDNVWNAASEGSLPRVQAFLAGNPAGGPDVADEQGYTPLMAACAYGHPALVTYLLSLGAQPNLRDADGNTSIHHCEFVACLELLLQAGGDPSLRNGEGKTAGEMKREELADEEADDSEEEQKALTEMIQALDRLTGVIA